VRVVSERADQSLIRVNRALAHFRRQTERLLAGAEFGVAPRQAIGAQSAATTIYDSQDAILRIVAIGEDFSIARLVERMDQILPQDPTVLKLWDAELARSGDAWEKRSELWKQYLAVDIGEFPGRDPLRGFIAARNAIAHGLGSLTRKQLQKKQRIVGSLNAAGIEVHGEAIVVNASHVEECARVVKSFIQWLDSG